MNTEQEIWKDIPEYEGLYQVSNQGRIKRLKKSGVGTRNRPFKRPEKILKPFVDGSGYFRVELTNKQFSVHRLVAISFIPNEQNKPTVNHIDGNKTNNKASNLEWATYKEQAIHAVANGLFHPLLKGEQCYVSKLTNEQVRTIRAIGTKIPSRRLAKTYNVGKSTILRIRRNQIWTHI